MCEYENHEEMVAKLRKLQADNPNLVQVLFSCMQKNRE